MSDALPLWALVPARAGSRGLPGKNLRPLAGRPLYMHAVAQARAAGAARVILTTDIAEILSRDHGPDVTLLPRPAELAGDAVPMDPVIAHALAALPGPARVVLLQPTSPLRRVEDIRAAIAAHEAGGHDLVMTVTRADSGVLKWGRLDARGRFRALVDPAHSFMNRQALPPVWRPNGAVHVFDADWFRARGRLACDAIGAVEMPPERSADIDTAADFARIEATLATRDTPEA